MGKHPQLVYIQVCLNRDPQEKVGATIGGRIFTYEYKENCLKNLLLKK